MILSRPAFSPFALALALVLGCGGSTTPVASVAPPAPVAEPAAPPEAGVEPVSSSIRDPAACVAPGAWVEAGCASTRVYTDGCWTRCSQPGASAAERRNPAACGAGETCTLVDERPVDAGAADVCGVEAYLCLPEGTRGLPEPTAAP